MEIKDIINLANAGYTRAEIEAMAKGLNTPAPNPTPNPDPTPAPNPNPTPAPIPNPNPTPAPNQANDFSAQLAALTAAIQANGILNSTQPKQETPEDILANILDPGRNKEGAK